MILPETEHIKAMNPVRRKTNSYLDFKFQIPQKIPFNLESETMSCTYEIIMVSKFKGNCMQ